MVTYVRSFRGLAAKTQVGTKKEGGDAVETVTEGSASADGRVLAILRSLDVFLPSYITRKNIETISSTPAKARLGFDLRGTRGAARSSLLSTAVRFAQDRSPNG
jgi:hypothetical protein